MDEVDTLFNKTIFKSQSQSPNLSNELDFDEKGINCTKNGKVIKLGWNESDLDKLLPVFRGAEFLDGCLTKGGHLIERLNMLHLLLKDQSFSARPLIPRDWLETLFHL